MKLIFVRHGDPDYAHDDLTEKGKREAALLAKRVKTWEKDITEIYLSPLGRAQATARYCLNELGDVKTTTYDWLREFAPEGIKNEKGEVKHVPWDYLPTHWTDMPTMYNKDTWTETPMFEGSNIKEYYGMVCDGIDGILAKYGYKRKGNMYTTEKEKDDTVLVFFCHLGVSLAIISHLINIAPTMLWQNFFVAATSVTVVGTEERVPGTAAFRVERLGDTNHLNVGGEPVSRAGYYNDVFQG